MDATVAILIPCYNEELTIAEVVRQFRAAVPGASIYVFDNNSSDRTAELARSAGAGVFSNAGREKATSCSRCSARSRLTFM